MLGATLAGGTVPNCHEPDSQKRNALIVGAAVRCHKARGVRCLALLILWPDMALLLPRLIEPDFLR